MLRMSAQGNNTWLQSNLCSLLYDPSVFDKDGTTLETGVAPNSLAAIAELVAGQWEPWPRPIVLSDFQGNLGNYSGVEYPFLVGSSNGVLSYSEPEQVYSATAEAISSWVLDPDVSAQIESFTFGNWGQKSVTSTLPLHGGAGTRMPLSAIGFSRVGLGRRRFALYAEERMARLAVERMLTLHHTAAVREGRQKEMDAAIERVQGDGYKLVNDVLNRCGLDEHTDLAKRVDNNQVLDAIRDKVGIEEMASQLADKVAAGVKDMSSIVTQVDDFVAELFHGEPDKFKVRHSARAIEWSVRIQGQVLAETLRLISHEGLLVTELVLGHVERRIREDFTAQLIAEKTGYLNSIDPWPKRSEQLRVKTRGNKVAEPVRATVKAIVHGSASVRIERDLRDIAAGVLADLADNFLHPLLTEVSNALATARYEQVQPWFREMSDGPVPTRLAPAPNEILLDDVSNYPKSLERLLTESSGSVAAAVADVTQALYGSDRKSDFVPEMFQAFELSPWVPRLVQDQEGGGTPSTATIRLRLGTEDLRRRVSRWVRVDQQMPIGRHVNESLREYLVDPRLKDAERTRRSTEFALALDQAFDRAQPLAELAGLWIEASFGLSQQQTFTFSLSPVPLVPGDSGYDASFAVLAQRLNRQDVSQLFESSARGDMEVYATMTPLPPSAFGSLLFPITQAWGADVGDHPRGTGSFYRNRRARPLMEALPLRPHVRLTLARGWTTARLIGALQWDTSYDSACTLSLDGKTFRFLHPTLAGPPKNTDDELASVLESALLAEMLAAAGDRTYIDALHALMRLGNADGGANADQDYAKLNPRLVRFLETTGDSAVAAKEMAARLSARADAIQRQVSEFRPTSEFNPFPGHLGVAPLKIRALRDIARQLDGLQTHLSPEPPLD